MKKMVNKRAISALVATVLLVLITIAATGIIYGAIMPIIRSNMETSQKCFDAALEIKSGGYTCTDGDTLRLQVGRGEKTVALEDIQIQLSYAGTSKSFRISNTTYLIGSATGIPGPNEEIAYEINLSKIPNMPSVDSASVAAVLTIGNTRSMCSATQPIAISQC